MLIKTVESLRKLSAAEEKQMPVDLSGPQLVGVLERLTLALKAPEQRANGNGPRALPAKAGGDGGEHK